MMSSRLEKLRQTKLDAEPARPISFIKKTSGLATKNLRKRGSGISIKLAILITVLVTLTATAVSWTIIRIVDERQLESMLERGAAVTAAVAAPAGYSLLAEDRLALDNLVARVSSSQSDLEYIAIVDSDNLIAAHNRLNLSGTEFVSFPGTPVETDTGLKVRKLERDGRQLFEFTMPIFFNDNEIGYVFSGIDSSRLITTRNEIRRQIILIVALILPIAIAGAFYVARMFTYPIERLSEGVSRLQDGTEDVIVPVTANDEMASLTRNFNEMARKLSAQKRRLIRSSEELEKSYVDIVKILAAALDARDNYTYGHSSRVARLSLGIGRELGLSSSELKELEMTCLLHDIGKIRIPDHILNKPGRLDKHEYLAIREHPAHGVGILELADSLKKYIPSVLHHHEWYDGTGYPGNLSGESIPLFARIIAIADTYDAMTSSRPYRQGLPRETAIDELNRFKGRQFDPRLVDLFVPSLDSYDDVCDIPLGNKVTC